MPSLSVQASSALQFDILFECPQTRARCCNLWLPHCPGGPVETPVFMPVGTQGAMKGITVGQLEQLDCRILLGNTYHLGHRPGPEVLRKAGGLHKFMSWPRAILTDSGGFQMVSLNKLSEVTEEGVRFTSPHNHTEMLLTPEESVGNFQNALGSDIVMQLDHVVHVLTDDKSMKKAMERSIHVYQMHNDISVELDNDVCLFFRSITAHKGQKSNQNLFAITQGGLDPTMRIDCINEMLKRKDELAGFAIGGLSGGESKDDFWRIIKLSAEHLPLDRPRYVMGVGFPTDLVVCIALGCDMFDCVYPTRTGRFGNALVPWGQLNLRQAKYATDFRPIDEKCSCPTCSRPLSRAWLHSALSGRQVSSSAIISLHNLAYMLGLMKQIREAISANTFPEFVHSFFERRCYKGKENESQSEYEGCRPPTWACDALKSVGIDISDIGRNLNGVNCYENGNDEIESKRSRNSSLNCESIENSD
ncbi:queuine tRNA-ribosyltransferase [Schistosoma bovis]|uniref:Queuine tRNA-ribosyltransferase catalytic subunit 1 n=1 Tax=Schistosoma bovis TaxID=6184 RepID=A0A430Q3J8_SCHBO|nr:queuine tRNA-ribosyltransferase [Schistosoma bovis]